MSATPTYNYTPGSDESLLSGNFDVATAGTAEQMTATPRVLEVVIQAKSANTGVVYVGGSNVSSSDGVELSPGQSMSLSVTNLDKIWLDVSVSGEGVKWTATKE